MIITICQALFIFLGFGLLVYRMDGWMDGWMDGCRCGWMGEWMYRWIEGCLGRWLAAQIGKIYITIYKIFHQNI